VPPLANVRTRSPAEFETQLQHMKDHVAARADALSKRILAEVLIGWVRGNPVADQSTWVRPRPNRVAGHTRRNFQVVEGGGTATELPGVDPTGDATIAEGLAKIADLPRGTTAKIVNPTQALRFLASGWSTQAAPGWMDTVMNDVRAKYARVV
jgi:hypothetical protein